MKKLFQITVGFLLIFSLLITCNNDDDGIDTIDPSSPENLLPKRITGSIGGESLDAVDFYYDENKIVEIKGEYRTIKFIYTNNLITNVSTYWDDDPTVPWHWRTFSYDTNGRIKKVMGTRESELNFVEEIEFIDTIEYASNGDFTMTSEDQNGNVSKSTFKVKNGNVVEATNFSSSGSESISYDTKNSPWKNIIGAYNLSIYNVYLFTNSDIMSFKNNVTQITTGEGNITVGYDYNQFDYPRNITSRGTGSFVGGISTIEYY